MPKKKIKYNEPSIKQIINNEATFLDEQNFFDDNTICDFNQYIDIENIC